MADDIQPHLKTMDYIDHYDSPLGGITMVSDGTSLTGLWFDGEKYFGTTLSEEYEEKGLPVFAKAREWLDIYFSGKAPGFTPPLSIFFEYEQGFCRFDTLFSDRKSVV